MSFLNLINGFLIRADFMTKSPSLKFEGKRGYRTAIGGVINIILIVVTCVGIIYFTREMFVRNEPIVIESSMDGHQVGPYKVAKNGFTILVGLQYSNSTYYVNERVYTINTTAAYNRFDPEKGQVRTFANLTRDICANYFTNEELNTTMNLKMMWCFKPGDTTVEGFWGAKNTASAKMFVNKCVNTTENNNHCLPDEEINRFLQGGILSMFTTNSFLNLKDPDFPVDVKLQNWFTSINVDLTYDYFYNLRELLFEDDHGLLLKSISLKNYFYFETPHVLYYGKRGSLLATINLQGNRYGTKIMRSYAKIQDVLTRIGGLFKALSVIAHFLTDYLSELKFWADSVNCFTQQLKKNPRFYNNFSSDTKNITLSTIDKENKTNHGQKIKTININHNHNHKITKERDRHRDTASAVILKSNYPDISNSSIATSEEKKVFKENPENPRLTITYRDSYTFSDLSKDMLSQIVSDVLCLSAGKNKDFIYKKNSYKNISNKLLSTNYLFKQMYLLEKIIDSNFAEEHLQALHHNYLRNVISDPFVEYDDSNGFENTLKVDKIKPNNDDIFDVMKEKNKIPVLVKDKEYKEDRKEKKEKRKKEKSKEKRE